MPLLQEEKPRLRGRAQAGRSARVQQSHDLPRVLRARRDRCQGAANTSCRTEAKAVGKVAESKEEKMHLRGRGLSPEAVQRLPAKKPVSQERDRNPVG